MIRDIADIAAPSLSADVCIVGSGAAGITLAHELTGSGLKVIVLEGGRRDYDERSQQLYLSELRGLKHGGIHRLRFRSFGGTTTRWAGQGLPLFDIDFEQRDWVPSSGWPISRRELEPYYARATRIMAINEFAHDGAWPSALPPPPPFDPELVLPYYSQFTSTPNFAETQGAGLGSASNVTVVLGANVTTLVTDPSVTEVQAVRTRGFDGQELDVRAGLFVVCAGGIETARILLTSDRYADGGIGNGNDLVGRFFQDHPGITVGAIHPSQTRALSETFRPRRAGKVKFQPLFMLAPSLVRAERLLNSNGSVLFHMSQSASIDSGKLLLRSLRRPELRPQARSAARTVLGDPMPLVRAFTRYSVLRRPALDPMAVPCLTVGCEQAPNPDSRVTLSEHRDELGMRRTVLDWQLTEAEIRAWRRSAEIVATEFERLGLGRIDLDGLSVPDDPGQLSDYVVDSGHHMGTTRMSVSPETGVVDPCCRVHGVENLYIGSSSVFPTGGFSNPTLTIIALAIRIADAIKQRSARQGER